MQCCSVSAWSCWWLICACLPAAIEAKRSEAPGQAALNPLGAHRLQCLLCSGTAELLHTVCSTAADLPSSSPGSTP